MFSLLLQAATAAGRPPKVEGAAAAKRKPRSKKASASLNSLQQHACSLWSTGSLELSSWPNSAFGYYQRLQVCAAHMSAYQCSAPLYVQVVSSESEDDSDESEPSDDDDDVYELDAPSPAIAPKVRTNKHQASCSL